MNTDKKIIKKRGPVVVDLDLDHPVPGPTKGLNLQKEEPWRVRRLKAEKEKLMRDAIKVLRFLERIVTKTPGDPIPIRRRQIIDVIKEDADKSETELQRRADLAMHNFGFKKGLDAESRDVSYVVPKKEVKDLCELYVSGGVKGREKEKIIPTPSPHIHDPIKGALEELEEIKNNKSPAKIQPVDPARITMPKKVDVKPAKKVELSDEVREKLLGSFIDNCQKYRKVGFNVLVYSIGGGGTLDDKEKSQVRSFLAQLAGDSEIRESGKNELGWEAYEFTERGLAKYADKIIQEGSHERLLIASINLSKTGQEMDAETLAKRWMGYSAEVGAFLARMLETGEMEKNDDEKYNFTGVGLDKYANRLFWYPAFRLTFNPFSTFDAAAEYRGDLPMTLISEGCFVPMIKRVKSRLSARMSAIIEGERGCGKTAIIVSFEVGDGNLTTSVSPRKVNNIKNAIRRHAALKIGERGDKIVWGAEYGGLTQEEYRKYKVAVAEVARAGSLFDVPDNLPHKDAFELADLCARILDEGGFVILFATLEQARMLKRLDTFARFPVIKFERPPREFFIEMFIKRLGNAWAEESAECPLSDAAIDKVAEMADRNPRRFIILCGHLLTEMRERGVDKPIDEKMVDELLKDKDVLAEAPVDVTEALQAVMRDFGSKGAGWIKVKDIKITLVERYGMNLRPETIGRRLTGMGYQRRYAPNAEYLVTEVTRKG